MKRSAPPLRRRLLHSTSHRDRELDLASLNTMQKLDLTYKRFHLQCEDTNQHTEPAYDMVDSADPTTPSCLERGVEKFVRVV